MNKKFIVFILTLFSFIYTSKAGHFAGTEITYQHISGTNYQVTLKYYRECSGIPLCGCSGGLPVGTCTLPVSLRNKTLGTSSPIYNTINLQVVSSESAKDIIQLCQLQNSLCSNCGTKTPGSFTPGIEIYVFTGIVDISFVPISVTTISVGYGDCCRNSAISTIVNPSSVGYFNEAIIYRAYNNKSPVINSLPLLLVGTGTNINYNLMATDPDGDSLSYHKAPSMSAISVPVSYTVPYSINSPFPFLGAPNANGNFPFGYKVDSITGDILFRPQGVFTADVVYKIKEWRRLANGTVVQVGESNRETTIFSKINVMTTPPSITTYDAGGLVTSPSLKTSYTTLAGQQICFNMFAEHTDTTDLTWVAPTFMLNSGATFTKLYDTLTRATNGPIFDSVKFCWTPPIGSHNIKPYAFFVKATSRSCSVNSSNSRGFLIKVDSSNGVFTPLIPPNQIIISNNIGNSLTLNWTSGSGSQNLVVMRAINNNIASPVNGVNYIANSNYGSANSLIGTGSYVVYNGTNNSVTVSGLNFNTVYFVRVYTFNLSGSNTAYLNSSFAQTSTQTLPVELKEFTVQLNEKGEAELKWTTAAEINNSHFEVERSLNSENSFVKIGMVKGHGNSNLLKTYNYIDKLNSINQSASTIYYRLKQVDYDGKSAYSHIVSLDLNQDKEIQININPNPFKDEINISGVRELSSLKIYEPSGKELMSKILSGSSDGSYIIKINSTEKGLFILKINNETFKLIKE